MKNIFQVALASFGMSGRVFHGPLLKVHPGFHVSHILERTKSASAEMFPEAEIVRSWQEIISNPSIDLVVVNTPDYLHTEMTRDALLAGKHVVVEKPFTLHSGDADTLILLAREKQCILTVYQNRRWDGDFMTVRQLLSQQTLGEIVDYEAHFDRYRSEPDMTSWKENASLDSSILYNLGSHLIDQALVLFGMPRALRADLQVVRPGASTYDYFDLTLIYEGVLRVRLKSSYTVAGPGPKYLIHGRKGSFLKYGFDSQEKCLAAGELPGNVDWGMENPVYAGWLTLADDQGTLTQERLPTIAGDYPAFYENLHRHLCGEAPLPVIPEEARDVIQIIELTLKSHTERKEIVL